MMMMMIMKSLLCLDARFQCRIAPQKQISRLNLLTNISIYLLHSVTLSTLSKRSILYTPLHFAFAAFALTKIVTHDALMNLQTALLIAAGYDKILFKTIQRASNVPRTDAPPKQTEQTDCRPHPSSLHEIQPYLILTRIIQKHSI